MSRNRPNYLSVILSVTLVLLLIGLFALTAVYSQRLAALFKEKVDFWVELKPELLEAEVQRVVGLVRSQSFVKKETLTFITRDQAVAAMKQELGDEAPLVDLPNMMRDVVRFNVQADAFRSDSLVAWRSEMVRDSAVAEVHFEALSTGNASENIQKIGWFLLGIAILLVFGAIALIHNTIRLALYANRFMIKNQELVGASWPFIARPYVQKGMINGLISGFLATAILLGLVYASLGAMPDLAAIHDPSMLTAICLGMIALGGLLGNFSSRWVVNKFLNMRLEDLY